MGAKPSRIVQRTRIHPLSHSSEVPLCVALSTIDSTVVRFSPTWGVWYFDAPLPLTTPSPLAPHLLQHSLAQVLAYYPQWAGRLTISKPPSITSADPSHTQTYTQRHGHCHLTFHNSAHHDPGVEFIIAESDVRLESFAPSLAQRISRETPFTGTDNNDQSGVAGVWNATEMPSDASVAPDSEIALQNSLDNGHSHTLPSMVVQVTTFACGGVAIAVKLPHPLADAHTLVRFMKDWSAIHTASLTDAVTPLADPPLFDPSLLDQRAAKSDNVPEGERREEGSEGPVVDQVMVARARALPLHRYDWWASSPGCPSYLTHATAIPDPIIKATPPIEWQPDTPMIWQDWDMLADVDHYLIHYSATDLTHLYNEAVSTLPTTATDHTTPIRISKLDALLAHVWRLILRARHLWPGDKESGAEDTSGPAYLDMSTSLRQRVAPELPSSYIGSPIIISHVSKQSIPSTSTTVPLTLGAIALAIRTTLLQFNGDAVSALLYEARHEVCPQRLWQAFCGRRHTLVTSWLRLGIYDDVSFGTGVAPRFVDAVMPAIDGIMQVMESGPKNMRTSCLATATSTTTTTATTREREEDLGVMVALHLESEAMERLLKDPLLRSNGLRSS
eukprot:TRINITY_DN9942_c0_g1_i1.p1 TRINITY_DN9942_c0_g1~~TRINITY_DN9942_c0_g1_i1.p1  ORF type:complete len:616 (-),score=70.55 TRINITY_DN9942_c0_g1_i1:26-1873(-)